MKVVIESSAGVEFPAGGSRGPATWHKLAKDDRLLLPDIVLAELTRMLAREGHTHSRR